MTDKSKKTFDGDSSKRLEKEVQKEADALWESGVLGADAIEQIGKEHWRTPYLAQPPYIFFPVIRKMLVQELRNRLLQTLLRQEISKNP